MTRALLNSYPHSCATPVTHHDTLHPQLADISVAARVISMHTGAEAAPNTYIVGSVDGAPREAVELSPLNHASGEPTAHGARKNIYILDKTDPAPLIARLVS